MLSEPLDEIEYPYHSEEPVTESDWHYLAGAYLRMALDEHFRERNDVYVACNVFVYWQKGDRDKKVSPDVFVCFGVEKRQRRSYQIWKEGAAPEVVFELTSASSRISDQGDKRAVYEMLGVREYFLFDPLGEYIPRRLRGYRRKGDDFLPIEGGDKLLSEVLGLEMRVEGRLLRLADPASGKVYQTYGELEQGHGMAEQARREAELARQQAEQAHQDAEQARREAERARQQAEQALEEERRKREALERRLRELD